MDDACLRMKEAHGLRTLRRLGAGLWRKRGLSAAPREQEAEGPRSSPTSPPRAVGASRRGGKARKGIREKVRIWRGGTEKELPLTAKKGKTGGESNRQTLK